MRRLPSAVPCRGGQVGLSPAVEELLVDVVADGFTLYCCGPKAAPCALVACYEWDHEVDLLVVRAFDRVITARAPKRGLVDIFAPEVVVWAYEGPAQQALRALLELVHPAHPDAPRAEYPAPASLHVPRVQQRPMTIQLPTPSRATARAARLTTGMTTHGGDRVISADVQVGAHDPGWSPGLRASGPDAGVPAASQPLTPAEER